MNVSTLNLSVNYNISQYPGVTQNGMDYVIDVPTIIADVCSQIDDKIILGLFFILTFYVTTRFILPIAIEGFKGYIHKDILDKIYNYYFDISETFALGSVIMILAFSYLQGWNKGYWIWMFILAGFTVLTAFYKINVWINERSKKKSGIQNKELIKDEKEKSKEIK